MGFILEIKGGVWQDKGGKFRVSVEKLEGVWQDKGGHCRVSEKLRGGAGFGRKLPNIASYR